VTALVGGLFAGLGLMILREITDQSIREEREVASILDKGVLAGIPLMVSEHEVRRQNMMAMAAVASTIVFSSGLGLAVSYFMKRLA
jgi:hypothetical protein